MRRPTKYGSCNVSFVVSIVIWDSLPRVIPNMDIATTAIREGQVRGERRGGLVGIRPQIRAYVHGERACRIGGVICPNAAGTMRSADKSESDVTKMDIRVRKRKKINTGPVTETSHADYAK